MGQKKLDEQATRVKEWLILQKHEFVRESRPYRLRALVFLEKRLAVLQEWLRRKTHAVDDALVAAREREHAEREARWASPAPASLPPEASKSEAEANVGAKSTEEAPAAAAPVAPVEAEEELEASEALILPEAFKTTPNELLQTLEERETPVVVFLTGRAKGRYDLLGKSAKEQEWKVTHLPLAEAARKLHLLVNSFRNRELGAGGRQLVLVDAREASSEELSALVRPLGEVSPMELLRVAILLAPAATLPRALAATPAVRF